jgi:protein tyrosine phosphatase (PTP) superfamily phosphohydrolase (DUF442 family)
MGRDMPPGWANIGRRAGYGICLGLAAVVAVEARSVFFGRNWHELLPNQAFRSAQLSDKDLVAAVHKHGIQTVVNLRGTSPGSDWYDAESRATRDVDIAQEDITLSALRLPAPDELRRLVEVLDHAAYPLLLHCRQGVDRTGLASALLLLLHTDTSPAVARAQLSLRYGHVAIGPTRCMLQFLDLYDGWLLRQNRQHSPDTLREWADHGYCPGRARGLLELTAPAGRSTVGASYVLHVRITNTSLEPWPLHPGTETGVHVRFLVFDPNWSLVQAGRAGQFEGIVPPSGTMDLELVVNPPATPGPHFLVADLVDGNHSTFAQFGGSPLEVAFTVGSPEG